MSENEKISRINESKKKLAKAFEKLENIIEKKIKAKSLNVNSEDILELKNKLQATEEENQKIAKDYQEIVSKYYQAQTATTEVAEELTTSINFIEKLLEKENANN